MEMHGDNPERAAHEGIEILKHKADGYGGVIVMNNKGQFGAAFNTPRMARAYINSEMNEPVVAV
jgi:beta-aspartyl-peptidase (threonine type)